MKNSDLSSPDADPTIMEYSEPFAERVEYWYGQIHPLQEELRGQTDNPCATCWRATNSEPLAAVQHNPKTAEHEIESLGSAHVKALKKAITRRCQQNPEPESVEWTITGIETERSLDIKFSPLSVKTSLQRWITIMPFVKNARCSQDMPDERQGMIPQQH